MRVSIDMRPFSEACEENKQPILEALKQVYTQPGNVLEIGSGTGQHAVYFSQHLPHVTWQPSDMAQHLAGIEAWRVYMPAPNLLPPLVLDVSQRPWPVDRVDYVFSANTAHIMSWEAVVAMFLGIAICLNQGGVFCLYGPFNDQGQYTSISNARFDQWLKSVDARQGIRDIEQLDLLANEAGLTWIEDIAMPVNNRILVWRKVIDTEY